MRIEIISERGKGFALRLAPETPSEDEQLRDLKSLGVEARVGRVEFAVPRRRNKNGEEPPAELVLGEED